MQNPVIVAELKRIAASNGGILQPRAVIDAAREPESPLHSQFEWDDTKASESWRLHQARQLIRVVVAYEPVGDGKQIAHRVFVSLTPDREIDYGGYRVTSAVMSDETQRRQLLADAKVEMKRFADKYKSLNELAEVFKAMEPIIDEHPVAKAS